MLGVGEYKIFPEEGVGDRQIVIIVAGDDCPPAATGNVREAYMIAKAETAEEEGDPKWGGLGRSAVKSAPSSVR